MVTEMARIDVHPGREEEFVSAYRSASGLIRTAGARSVRLTRTVERPSHFVLLVEWDSVAAHEAFRASEAFGRWRGQVGPFFAGPPEVEHVADV